MSRSVQLAQLAAMMRYEFKMIRRGRMLIVVMLALLSLSIIMALVTSSTTTASDSLIQSAGESADGVAKVVVFLVWSPISVTLAILLPILVADTIPRDEQTGVRELLDSLPVTPGTYLNGKLAGTWLALIGGTGIVLLITGVVWRLTLGAYDVLPYISMVVFGAWALIIINCGLGVLLPAGQPGRRRAVGLMIGLFIILPVATAMDSLWGPNSLIGMLSPVRRTILSYFLLMDITGAQLVTAILTGLSELVIVWLVVREWLKWRKQHL